MIVQKIDTYAEFWRNVVTPDFNESQAQIDDLRRAFHVAISLFHMSDWVYWDNEAYVKSNFTFLDRHGVATPVSSEAEFANSLRDLHRDFELIRGIANSAKHLKLKHATKAHHSHAPSNAANTVVQSTGCGQGGYGAGPYRGTPRVMLEGPNGNDLEYSDLVKSVHSMWLALAAERGWSL